MPDKSNGYESIAEAHIQHRRPTIGPAIVRKWAEGLRPRASILDLGCGHGVPISEALLRDGFAVHGVDASARLVAEFRTRFPNVPVECGSVEESRFFGRTFDAVVAWGLMFILPAESQRTLIGKVARALHRDGRFLFTAPKDACAWTDGMTGRPSLSLGQDAYEQELAAVGLRLVGNDEDEGQNYYFFAIKP